ncbi:C39 family peptidase [Aerococcus vaginalis]
MAKSSVKLNATAKAILVALFLVTVSTLLFAVLSVILAVQNRAKTEQLEMLNTRVAQLEQTIERPLQAYGDRVRSKLEHAGLNANLMLQKDERWNDLPYGWGEWENYGRNACALAVLTMVHASYNNGDLTPDEILDWAGNDYFTNSGTSWSIFPAFAKDFNYKIDNLGDDLKKADDYLRDGTTVIASVKPGRFTYVGHIILLTHLDADGYHLLDPNDDPFKEHSLIDWEHDELQDEIINLWALEPK